MKRLLLLYSLLLSVFLTPHAQDLEVVSMQTSSEICHGSDQRFDLNGEKCALIKVQMPIRGAEFRGSIIGDTPFKINEYWVYLVKGTRWLKVQCPDYYTLMVNFGDYGIKEVGSQCVYYLKIRPKGNQPQPSNDMGSNYAVFRVSPPNAKVSVGDKDVDINADGTGKILLDYGTYIYRVEAHGYTPQSGSVTVTKGDKTECKVNLVSELATLTIESTTPGTSIYVNDEHKGTGRWSGQLYASKYRIEGKKDGYRPTAQTIDLGKSESRSITLPALDPIYGVLDIAYDPIDAAISVDGVSRGTTPAMLRDLLVGSHKVTISKDGYKPVTQTVTIREGETANLQGRLEKAAVQTASNGSASASGDRLHFTTTNGVGFDMIFVKGGTFQMGATRKQDRDAYDDEKPVHSVTLSDYYIGETEVTQALWQAVMGSNPSKFKGGDLPVENVSWNDCQDFIRKLNEMTGQEFCLPTEAQWEYAARGGSKSLGYKYSGSNDLGSVAWYRDNSSETHPVKTKVANELGIYDMSGNVWEWCQDYWVGYSSASQTDPAGPKGGSYHVFRGGCWCEIARYCRSSTRDFRPPYADLGLRLALRARRP